MFFPLFWPRWRIAPVLAAGLLTAAALPVAAQTAVSVRQADAVAWQYTVRPGDTLIGLGRRYLRDPARWPLLQRDNHLANPRQIPPGTVLQFPVTLLREQPSSARLTQALGAGAQIEVPAGGSAVIELANGTRLSLQPGSTLALDTLSLYADGLMADTRLRLQHGQVIIRDNPRRLPNQNLRILTPSAQAVVRGTAFRVGVGEDATREETLEGAVDLHAAGAQVRVQADMGSLARDGQPPMAPVPLLPAPDVSALPGRIEQLPLRFPLPAQAGAAAWFGQVVAADDAAHVLLQGRARGGALSFADLPNGRYVLQLRAVDANGLQGQDARHAFTVFARPFFPLLTAPAAGAVVRVPRPELAWSAVLDVARTRLQLVSGTDFAQPQFDVTVQGTQWAPPSDLHPGVWSWRAASLDAQGAQGPWSAPQVFRYVPGPGPADLSKAGMQFDADHLLLDLPAAPAGQHYSLTLSNHANLQPVLATRQTAGGAVTLPRPDAGKRYLAARLVDDSDGTQGPQVVQVITVPERYPYLWMLLVPLLGAL